MCVNMCVSCDILSVSLEIKLLKMRYMSSEDVLM